ncbi:carbohydrate ABC transporter permease [Brucella gallinifaecis]|uniref:Sugar ABC transporter permease n=1 Tax=Brucella gallinifaecis TaxID=215590 RepID=A0A502BSV0_9HYPH|nr:sugar ABC transporter permease [Brucella gallinifaecis]TPF76900.1 sugar ABC transporter permease [Brucella gallinifaecis]
MSALTVKPWSSRIRHILHTERGAAFILLAPVVILFTWAVVYPLFETIRLSFYEIRGLSPAKWAGLKNYVMLAGDASFRMALWTTLIWTVATTVLSVGIGWGLAVMCSLAPRITLPFRVMIFMTYGIAEAVSGFIWLGIYRPGESGMLNAILNAIGLETLTRAWLGDVSTALGGVIVAYAWTQVGLPLMTCFASIQTISKSVLEAAYIDGAKPVSMMRHIILPLSMPGLKVAIFINLLGSLRAFDMIFVLTGGGPVRSTETVGYFMFRESMMQFKLGYGAAATVILLASVLFVSIPLVRQRTREAK